jgi:hypothetical protein
MKKAIMYSNKTAVSHIYNIYNRLCGNYRNFYGLIKSGE